MIVKNLWLCGVALVVTGLLGIARSTDFQTNGLESVSQGVALEVMGGASVPCKWYKGDPDDGCGGDAKPSPMSTKCPKVATWIQDDNARDQFGKPQITITSYECCYSCGSRLYQVLECDLPTT